MKPKLKNFDALAVVAIATAAALTACQESTSPGQETPVTIKTNFDNLDAARAILDAPEKENTFYEFTATSDFGVTVDNDNVIGEVKKFDARRDDVTVDFKNFCIFYVGDTPVDYDSYNTDTSGHKVGPNKSNQWHLSPTDTSTEKWHGAGYTNVQTIVYQVTINVTPEDASDFEYTRRILTEHPTGPIYLTGANSMCVYIEDLINYNNIDNGGRIFGLNTVAVIRGDDETMEYGWGPGTTRSAEAYHRSKANGVTPQFQLTGNWMYDRSGMWPDTGNHPPIRISDEWITPANMFTEWASGNSETQGSVKGQFPLLGMSVLPLDVGFSFVDEYGYIPPDSFLFGFDLKFGIAAYQSEDLNSTLTQDVPMGGWNAIDNAGATRAWMGLRGIVVPAFEKFVRHKSVLIISGAEHNAKFYGDVQPIEAPAWVRDIQTPIE